MFYEWYKGCSISLGYGNHEDLKGFSADTPKNPLVLASLYLANIIFSFAHKNFVYFNYAAFTTNGIGKNVRASRHSEPYITSSHCSGPYATI